MRVRRPTRPELRRGFALVEYAIVLPILFMFVIGLVYVGLAAFRYQQVADLARQGARYAAVHGSQYASDVYANDNTKPAPVATTSDVLNYIRSQAVGLDTSLLDCTGTSWANTTNPTNAPTYLSAGNTKTNTVTVKVTFTWASVYIYHVGPVSLSSSSSSTMPMSY